MRYSIFDPTGNITAIITEPPASAEETLRRQIAEQIMRQEPSVEQAGFLQTGGAGVDGELMMAGGEFCGNASMSAAAWLAMENGAVRGDKCSLKLRVSGTYEPVAVDLEALASDCFRGRVSMPEALEITERKLPIQGGGAVPVIRMPGITHVIVPESLGRKKAEKILPSLCSELCAEAAGMMLIDEACTRITPLVFVPGAGTLVWEHSCASGTAAAGAYLAAVRNRKVRIPFEEPGGTLTAEAEPGSKIFIEGTVKLLCDRDTAEKAVQ